MWILRVGLVGFLIVAIGATLIEGRYGLDVWQTFLVAGIALGAIYALLAIGYTLVYGVLFMINFAHGEVFMAGTYTAFFVAAALSDAGIFNTAPWISIPLVLGTAMLVSMLVAIVLERIAYRPLRNAPRLVPLITAIGASLFLQNTFRGFYGAGFSAYPPLDIMRGTIDIGGFVIGRAQLVVIVSAILLMFALWYLVQYTRVGRAMRAVSEDKDVAAMMGINVDRVIVITFAIGGLLAGAAGVLYVQIFNQVNFAMGILPGIKAFTAAVIGGIGNIIGAMLGGLLLGILEALAPYLLLEGFDIPSINQLKDVVAFSALVLVLIIRPEGLLGRKENI